MEGFARMSRLECPHCKRWEHAEIYDARSRTLTTGISSVVRCRRCRNCGHRYKTVEVKENELLEFAFATLENEVAREEAARRKETEAYEDKLRRELQKSLAAWPAGTGVAPDAERRLVPRVSGGGSEEEDGVQ